MHLQNILITPREKLSRSSMRVWFSLSLIFAIIYSLLALQEAFSSQYVIQDDARQHIFWMRRFINPELFPNDLIADYFQSVAPWGYRSIYWLFAQLGIDPVILSKLFPLVLDILTTLYCFGVCLEIFPVPLAGFIASVLLNQQLWLNDGLVSATPRAFVYPLFLGFLYYVLRRSILFSGCAIALLGLFYPQAVLVASAILVLRLFDYKKGRLYLTPNSTDRQLSLIGLGIAFVVILFYAASSNEFAPVISVAEAKTWSEFGGAGNSAFFQDNLWDFFILGQRSGLLPKHLFRPTLMMAGLSLPLLLLYSKQFPLLQKIKPKFQIFSQVLLASVSLFFAAHLLLFKLHLPSRYTNYSFRICLAIAAGIVLCLLLDAVLAEAFKAKSKPWKRFFSLSLTICLTLTIILGSTFWGKFPKTSYVKGKMPELYQFFAQQPQDTLIASISKETDNLPTFSQRSVWVAWEYAVPYHLEYYNQIQRRATELIQAQYSPDITLIQNLIVAHGIDYIILDKTAFTPSYLLDNRWLRQWYHSLGQDIQENAKQGKSPVIQQTVKQCSRLQNEQLVVLEADCLL